jgi:hypothetical protein
MNRHLITTADERSWKFDRPVLFLGEWCRRYDRRQVWERMDAAVAEPYGLQAGQRERDIAYVQVLFKSLLEELSFAFEVGAVSSSFAVSEVELLSLEPFIPEASAMAIIPTNNIITPKIVLKQPRFLLGEPQFGHALQSLAISFWHDLHFISLLIDLYLFKMIESAYGEILILIVKSNALRGVVFHFLIGFENICLLRERIR